MEVLVLLVVCLLLYFLPSILGRNKRNSTAIFVLNLLLGWTLIGWIVALIWALTVEAPNMTLPSYSNAHVSQVLACSVCNAQVRRSDRFCPSCGREIGWQASQK
jgi:hypothetical protein